MRKRLLSLLTLLLTVGGGIFAQTWTAPEAPELPSAKSLLSYAVAPEVGLNCYVMNVGEGQFLTGGNVWATQISLTANGSASMPITLDDGGAEGIYKLRRTNDSKDLFYGDHGREGGYNPPAGRNLLFRSGDDGYVDENGQGGDLFVFNPAASGYYYLQSSVDEGLFPNAANEYAGSTGAGKYVKFTQTIEDENIEWALIPVESVGDAYAELVEQYDKEMEIYNARLALYEQVCLIVEEELQTYDPELSYEEYTDAYNSTDVETINKATTELAEKVVEARKKRAFAIGTEENPTDVTFLLVNPNFAGNMDGWTIDVPGGENKQYQSATYNYNVDDTTEDDPNYGVSISGFIEAWHPSNGLGNGKIFQQVELPMGKYVLGVDVMATNQINTDQETSRSTVEGFQLYALGGGIDNGVDVRSRNGRPEHYDFEFITAGGTTELGLRMVNATGNWFGADNFTMKYKGSDIDPYFIGLPGLISNCESTFEDADDLRANTTAKDAYKKALNAAIDIAADSSGESDYEGAFKALSAAFEALQASVADYQKLQALIEKVQKASEDYDGFSIGDTMGDLYQTYDNAYGDEVATQEEIEAWTASYETTLLEGIKASLTEASEEKPLKLSIFGSNLDYADNSTEEGWTVTVGSVNDGGAYKVNYHNGEVWKNTFACLQTIGDLPAGLYTVTAKAFYRNAPNSDEYTAFQNGENEMLTYLVAGSSKTPVPSLARAAVEGEAAPEGSNYAQTADGSGIWMPNTQQAAEWAFTNTDFFDCEVSTYLPNGGDLTFGTRNDEISNGNDQWSVWTQFDIYYKGVSVDALYDQMMNLSDQASDIVTSIATASEKLNDAIDAAENAQPTDSEEKLTDIINQLTEAITYAEEGQKLVDQLMQMLDDYGETMMTEDIESADKSFEALLEEANAANGSENFESNEQIQAWIDALPQGWVNYVMGQDMSGANETEAFDITIILNNPDLEMEATREQAPPYWDVDALGRNNGFQNNQAYSNEDGSITLSNFIESWTPSGTLADGKISQTLSGVLPKGYYRLEADGQSSNDAEGVYLMATNGTSTWTTLVNQGTPSHFAVDFESDGETVITVGILVKATNVSWIAFDNFVLGYIGTEAPTAVEGLAATEAAKPLAIYNLAGQRVQKAQKGIYIINGKKVVIR